MNRYQLQEEIGDGSFGRVIKAQNKETGEIVAIKHIKNKFKVSRRVFNCVLLLTVVNLTLPSLLYSCYHFMELIFRIGINRIGTAV